ncbi:MAG TPA: hypothetical protein VN643_09885 [Pyrinomonadaceae bacterium]|nr:hypothetical protein [Pyrinomonadaceae bacterium]
MPDNRNTNYEGAAQVTVDLVDHGHTPDRVSDAVLEALIEMSAESRIDIWHGETGLSVESLAALYCLYETGAGSRRSRLYADYEIGRKERERDSGQT